MNQKRIVAVEGLNGVGKSTLVEAYARRHPEVVHAYSTPAIYMADAKLKEYVLFGATPTASALYYLAALADTKRVVDRSDGRRFLFDRSIWSTLAAAYAKDPALLGPMMETVRILEPNLLIPDVVVVLRARFTTCQARIAGKSSGAEMDRDTELIFNRKYELYDRVKAAGYDVRFIDTDNLGPEEAFAVFEKLDIWRCKEVAA